MRCICFYFLLLHTTVLFSQPTLVLNERERARIEEEILADRLDNLLPQLMKRAGIDMWIIISREYNEDPIMETMLPPSWLKARRRTIFVFSLNPDNSVEKLAIARYNVGRILEGVWDISVNPNQWEVLAENIEKRNPKSIGLNMSKDFGLADGLVKTEYDEFMHHLPEKYKSRVVSAEKLAIAWLETRSEKELEIYPMICHLAHQILQEGLSEKYIHPGVTTTEDVVWALRQLVTDYGLDTWFHPTVDAQRPDSNIKKQLRTFSKRPPREVIQKGDLLHVDFGITYLRLNTDQQQHFYVLKDGETAVPPYLQRAFEKGNRVQDLLTSAYQSGKTGNQILKEALDNAKLEGIQASIYTHPIGLHGHAAGPTIGLWDQQGGVKGKGDYPLYPNTAYSIELFAASEIAEWNGKLVRIMLEEDGVFDGKRFYYLDGRQKEILTIPRKSSPQ